MAQHLYRNAVEMGRLHSKWLRLATVQDVMAIGRVLYRILDIDFQGDARGEVVINRCYFSRFYTGEVCRLMSAMDCGLFAGLSNGGELTFTSRITEGQPCCRALFSPPKGILSRRMGRLTTPNFHSSLVAVLIAIGYVLLTAWFFLIGRKLLALGQQ